MNTVRKNEQNGYFCERKLPKPEKYEEMDTQGNCSLNNCLFALCYQH